MRYFYTVLLLVVFSILVGEVNAQTLPASIEMNTGEVTYDGGSTSKVILGEKNKTHSAKVTINGNLTVTSGVVSVYEGCTLIINGDLIISSTGTANLVADGIVIVSGNLTIASDNQGSNENATIQSEGILVVGGVYKFDGKDNNETNAGNVFLSNPSDWDDGEGIEGSGGSLGDLINANPAVLTDELLEEFLENIDDPTLIPAVTWEGGTNSVWTESTNWKDDIKPNKYSRIIINKVNNGQDAFITKDMGEIVLSSIDLTKGSLIADYGSQLTILNDFTDNGNLVINNSSVSPASFIYKGNKDNRVATFNWSYEAMRWWFIGHPITNPSIDSYEAIKALGNDYRLQTYNGTKMANTGIGSNPTNPMDGYAVAVMNNVNNTIAHKGTLVTGDQSKELTGSDDPNSDGWNLVANPFASYYQLPIDADGFENTEGTIYVPTNNADNSGRTYATYNTKTGITTPENTITDGVLAPNQCFYIKVVGANQTLHMPEANRLHDSNKASLKSSGVIENDILRIKLNNGVATDEAVIAFRENGQLEYSRLDSEQKLSKTSASAVYSIKDDMNTVINVLPKSVSTSIPLGMVFKEGTHTINIDGLNSLSSLTEIVLEDKEFNISVTITNGAQYKFTTGASTNESRFVLHINKAEVPTAIEDELVDEVETNNINIYMQNQSTLNVTCNWQADAKVVNVYSISGKQLITDTFKGNNYTKNLGLSSGLYIVKVVAGSQVYTQKIMIN